MKVLIITAIMVLLGPPFANAEAPFKDHNPLDGQYFEWDQITPVPKKPDTGPFSGPIGPPLQENPFTPPKTFQEQLRKPKAPEKPKIGPFATPQDVPPIKAPPPVERKNGVCQYLPKEKLRDLVNVETQYPQMLQYYFFDRDRNGKHDYMTARRIQAVEQAKEGKIQLHMMNHPTYYWIDVNMDGVPDKMFINPKATGKCEDVVPYQEYLNQFPQHQRPDKFKPEDMPKDRFHKGFVPKQNKENT